jgi:uncharacterized protein YgiM (DUF1202 family)
MRFVLLLLCAAATSVAAQSTTPAAVTLHGTPGGSAIAELPRGAPIKAGTTRSGWTQVTIEGWVVSTRLGTRRDTLDRTVNGSGNLVMRAADGPRQAVVATLETGTLLKRVQDRNGWTRVRRAGWVRSAELTVAGRAAAKPTPARPAVEETKTAPAAPKPAPPSTSVTEPDRPATSASSDVAERALRATTLLSAPGGAERATIRAGSVVETLARDRGWVRVRVEGWIPERDLAVADSASESRVSAADLRANPEQYRGAVVRWEMQMIAFQRADALRKGMSNNEPYLLLRGPGSESALVYGAIPTSLMEQARALTAMETVWVTARVREGRSAPVGVPIIDLLSIAPAK